jgi:hypothetical protein
LDCGAVAGETSAGSGLVTAGDAVGSVTATAGVVTAGLTAG